MLNVLFGNLRQPIPGDVSLIISDSFFCPRDSPSDDVQICCPLDGIVDPKPEQGPRIRNKGDTQFVYKLAMWMVYRKVRAQCMREKLKQN